MKKCVAVAVGIIVFGMALLTMSNAQPQTEEQAVRVSCGESTFARLHNTARLFMKAHPQMKVAISKTVAPDGEIRALLEKSVDVAVLSRRITEQEERAALTKGKVLVERLVGYGGIVVVTNPKNPVTALTVEQLQKILTGSYTSWSQVAGPNEPIVVYSTGKGDPGTMRFLEQDMLGKKQLTSRAVIVDDFIDVMKSVAQTTGSIGCVRIRDAFESPQTSRLDVKILEIKQSAALAAIMPSRSNVGDGTYPLRRPYYLYYDVKTGPAVKQFADFAVHIGWGPQEFGTPGQ